MVMGYLLRWRILQEEQTGDGTGNLRGLLDMFILRSLSNSVTIHPWFPWIFLDAENFK